MFTQKLFWTRVIGDNFAQEIPGQFPSKEAHDILGAKAPRAVAQ
jgi:hypothetical protein